MEKSTVRRIAERIDARNRSMGLKAGRKRDEDKNFEQWVGAAMALEALGHEDTDWVMRVVTLLISTRGIKETQHLATLETKETTNG